MFGLRPNLNNMEFTIMENKEKDQIFIFQKKWQTIA